MNIRENVSLKDHSTMRLGGTARFAVDITSRMELTDALAWAESQGVPTMMIGDGSNIVWKDEGFPGLLLINKIMRFEISDIDSQNVYVTVGGGENWDSVIARTVAENLSGIEALSLIPGTAGATPVQNVGAYGQEMSNVLVTIEAYDSKQKAFVTLPAADCGFSYRFSRFKSVDRGRFYITAITMQLTRTNPTPPFYKSLQDYLSDHNITNYTPASIREAVIAIRTAKLPDPAFVANNGSFFANPVIDQNKALELKAQFPDMPFWLMPDGRSKIPAAWLMEHAGFRDYHDMETGMGTWPNQPLVFVNEHAAYTANLLQFKQKIVSTIEYQFGITLEQEPELLP